MASYNRVILIGNLTRDVDLKHTTGGTGVAEVGLAINRTWYDKSANQKKEETTFVDVTLFGRSAEVAAEYCSKGSPLMVEGRLQLDQWTDNATGQKRSKLKVVGESIQLMGSRGGATQGQSGGQRKPDFETSVDADDVPF